MAQVLILGAKGTLGQQLAALYPRAVCWDREDVDVLDFASLERAIRSLPHPCEAVVNCVAFNDVDGAEDKPDAAISLNADFPGRLAALCRELDIPLVHYSTNYVFDGVKGEYDERDAPRPISVYARSKEGGERVVGAATPMHYIVRTAVIFGPKGPSEVSKKSFVDIMLDLSEKHSTIRAVADEINSVTYAPDLAAATKRLLDERAPFGIYHLTNSGQASWYDMACEIFRIAGRDHLQVEAVPSSTFPRKARRPATAVLKNTKAQPLRPWQDALAEFLRSRISA
jgi:dTDP-4-dehydrorhamnose reductase